MKQLSRAWYMRFAQFVNRLVYVQFERDNTNIKQSSRGKMVCWTTKFASHFFLLHNKWQTF